MAQPLATAPDAQPFTLRAFRDSDYPQVAALFQQHDLEFIGSTNATEEFLREDWTIPNFDPSVDAVVSELPDGTLNGVIACYAIHPVPVRPVFSGYAQPEHRSAVSKALIAWVDERAKAVIPRVPDHARVVAEVSVNSNDVVWAQSLVDAGYVTHHALLTMLIHFDGIDIPAPVLPDGLRFVTYAEHSNLETWAYTVKTVFADHRGAGVEAPLSYYIDRYTRDIANADFDPTAWWLVMDGDTPAGICVTYDSADEFPNVSYIHQLGTMPQYRKRGIGIAMLYNAFHAFKAKGKVGVSLNVDGHSLTNAVALYERAGMRKAIQWDKYERELRPGVELTNQ